MNDRRGTISPEQIAEFIKTVNLRVRKPEDTELVDGNDAERYNQACDYPENSDYGLIGEALKANPGLSGKIVLEVGMGPGNLCLEMLKQGAAQIIGADPSKEMIRYVREKFQKEIANRRMNFVPESVYNLSSQFESALDLVVCQNTFHQLYHPMQALEEMVKATKSGGEVHIFDFRRDIDIELLAERIAYTKPEIWADFANSVCAALTKEEFRNLLGQIPGIRFSVTNATDPAEISNRARELIRLDPVPHSRDYRVSQKVVIYKN